MASMVPKSITYPNETDNRLRRIDLTLWGLTSTSLICLLLVVALTILYKPDGVYQSGQTVILAFIVICCFGATAAILPSECSRIFHHKQTKDRRSLKRNEMDQDKQRTTEFRGHHPTCGKFKAHILEVRGKMHCAGCMGLLTGAILAIAGSLMYSLVVSAIAAVAPLMFWAGFVSVLIGLFQYAKPLMANGWVHYLLNVIFVSGTFFLLVGVIEINGTLIVETYFLFILLYWILARIVLSNLVHQKTCETCESNACVFHPN